MNKNIEKEAQNFWEESEKNTFVQDMSHFRGSSNRWNDERWFWWGNFYRGLIEEYLSKYDVDFLNNLKKKNSLEWGIGGGVNARVLCSMFKTFYSVEISKANIIETIKQLKIMGFYNFKNNLIDASNPNEALKKIGKNKIDFILCCAVFQHMPSKEYVCHVLKIMNKIMKKGSYALFQTRNNDESGNFDSKNDSYKEKFISFTTFRTEEFKNILIQNNYELIENKFGYQLNVYDDMKESLRFSNYEYFFCKKI